ncbi:hypothetical protein KSS87_010845 [Heliosperma pusillum]|nr:hypothetical protein KSS87_010711 [Heliosperma pusillum]KAH9612749.1 hypothetical protein KSS87_010845 [Heliosperma pusillum]
MNASIKAVLKNPQSSCFQLRSAFFHSTSFLERGRRNPWNSRFNNNNFGKYRRNRFKEHMMKDANAYVDYLFQSWESEFVRDEEPSNKGPSWFNRSNHGPRKSGQGHQNKGRRGFSFCEDGDDDVETVFRSAFGDRFFFWSYVNEDYPNGRRSSRHSKSHKFSWRWRDQSQDEYDYTPEDTQKSNLASERTALGLSASGPLKLEDVKTAYRASALKWHPDRHQGSSKAIAEEKFKHCTSAYQSLCDSLAVN